MSLPQFAYHEPTTFDELFELWNRYGEDARYLSGGTALMLLMRAQLLHPSALLSLTRLPGLRGITHDNDVVRIGALTTHTEIAQSPVIRQTLPMLAESFGHIATRRVRNVATVGGNIAHANPHQDPPVSLTACDATAVIRGPHGSRRIAFDDLFVDYLQTSLEPGELLTAIEVPVPDPSTKASFVKFLPRSADDYATINVGVALHYADERIGRPRIVIGSMAPTPMRATAAERLLDRQIPSDAVVAEACAAVTERLAPEADFRGSPEYKLRIAPVIVRRALLKALRGPQAGNAATAHLARPA